MAVLTKTNRIDIRVTESDKALLEKAAKNNRQSLSSYIVSVVIKQAQLDLIKGELVKLSKEDYEYVTKLLNGEQEPSEELKQLFIK